MKTQIQPYLFFDGCCEEAVDFYCNKLGAERMDLMRYKDCPDQPPPEMVKPGSEEKVMHTCFKIGESIVMASDACCPDEKVSFNGFSLSLTVQDQNEAKRLFSALEEGGKVQMPLEKTFWSPCFGMVTDRFGVDWMVNVDGEPTSG